MKLRKEFAAKQEAHKVAEARSGEWVRDLEQRLSQAEESLMTEAAGAQADPNLPLPRTPTLVGGRRIRNIICCMLCVPIRSCILLFYCVSICIGLPYWCKVREGVADAREYNMFVLAVYVLWYLWTKVLAKGLVQVI